MANEKDDASANEHLINIQIFNWDTGESLASFDAPRADISYDQSTTTGETTKRGRLTHKSLSETEISRFWKDSPGRSLRLVIDDNRHERVILDSCFICHSTDNGGDGDDETEFTYRDHSPSGSGPPLPPERKG